MTKLSVILLAGGKGTRMQSDVPKQFLKLQDQPLALFSFDILKKWGDIVVVAPLEFRHLFGPAKFALPGERRQDSVYNGLKETIHDLILIHDAARPFVKTDDIEKVIEDAKIYGAAALACPLKFTVKEADATGMVKKTCDRSHLWEIQTPQVIRRDILEKGFEMARLHDLTVTDDASLAELAGFPVKLTRGRSTNIKVTTPEDLIIGHALL